LNASDSLLYLELSDSVMIGLDLGNLRGYT
jgi:hypothetical protein